MKRWIWMVFLVCLLTGCRAEETLETVNDEWIVPVMAQPREVDLRLPEDALLPVLEQDNRRLYVGQGYEIILETFTAGDLSATIRTLSGYAPEQLSVINTQQGEAERYDFVWATTGESGQQLGRAVILDDGDYHYCMTVLRDPGETHIAWQDVFGSFSLI